MILSNLKKSLWSQATAPRSQNCWPQQKLRTFYKLNKKKIKTNLMRRVLLKIILFLFLIILLPHSIRSYMICVCASEETILVALIKLESWKAVAICFCVHHKEGKSIFFCKNKTVFKCVITCRANEYNKLLIYINSLLIFQAHLKNNGNS